jgi:predicted Zn-dependent protease
MGAPRSAIFFLKLICEEDDSIAKEFLAGSFQLQSLSYSRADEHAADLYGLVLLYRVYGHVGGFGHVMDVLGNEEKGDEGWLFLRTHPKTKSRKEELRLEAERRGWGRGEG